MKTNLIIRPVILSAKGYLKNEILLYLGMQVLPELLPFIKYKYLL